LCRPSLLRLDTARIATHNATAIRCDLFVQEHSVPEATTQPVTVVVTTRIGEIALAVDPASAPVTAANFLRYVDAGFYDGGRFHRTVTPENNANANLKAEKIGAGIAPDADRSNLPNDAIAIEVIQGGIDPARQDELDNPIPLERTRDTGLRHVDGAISMARLTPDSAVSDFFICIGDQPELDYGGRRNPDGQGFAAFGRVTRGMEVVRAIQRSPADGQSLDPPVGIISIVRMG
jgi:peptidyl-prolyl cis-trans isomerase A (cyclophilin A)